MVTPLLHMRTRHRAAWIFTVINLAALGAFAAGLPGDVNLDGDINILDIQSTINIALGAQTNTPEADVDESQTVDVLDIQAMTNTVLGVGGLRQRVTGILEGLPEGPIQLVAISEDGRREQVTVSEDDGAFDIQLFVRTAWNLSIITAGNPPALLGIVSFPILGTATATLPLLDLSNGTALSLGSLPVSPVAAAPNDLRTVLAQIAQPLDTSDLSGNQLPDYLEPLFAQLGGNSVPLLGSLPTDFVESMLAQWLQPCLQPMIGQVVLPDLYGTEVAGIPALLQPAMDCLSAGLQNWMRSTGLPLTDQMISEYTQMLMDTLKSDIPSWLSSLQRPELLDQNNNSVPDPIEALLCISSAAPITPMLQSACSLDKDQNGIPDYCEDADSDGVPNAWDMDYRSDTDLDGDGVLNEQDIDANGDGVPDYAQKK